MNRNRVPLPRITRQTLNIENSRRSLQQKQRRGLLKQIEVLLSKIRHDTFRNNFRKCVNLFLLLSLITLLILIFPENSVAERQKPYHGNHVMMVRLVGEEYTNTVKMNRLMWELNQTSDQSEDNYYKIRKSKEHEKFETSTCKAMHKWQLESYPNCNVIHETNMKEFQYIAKGGFRDVWVMHELDGTKRVVKTLINRKDFTHREYDRHRRDSVAMSLLTASKHIPNMYGYCSNSGVFDYSSSGNLEDHIEEQIKGKKPEWTRQEKLRFSWQISAALAAFHNVDKREGFVSLSHTDIAPDQFLLIDGVYKLNDFNRARFIRWDVHKNKPCTFYVSKNPGKHRSPEEYSYKNLNEKIDVYSLGNVIWQILYKRNVFAEIKTKKVFEMVKHGKTPPILHQDSWQDEELAILNAIKMCWNYDPQMRASSRDVELFLRNKLKEFNVTLL